MSDLTALLEREASAEIESILAEARSRAAAMVAEARAEAEQILVQRRRSAEGQREAALVRARSAAALEASALRLQAQHAALEGVFEDVRVRLAGLPGDAKVYSTVIERMLAEALDSLGASNAAAVVVAPSDVALAQKALATLGHNLPVEADPSVTLGVRVRSKRRSAVENSLLARLAALEGELAAEVSRLLFAGGGALPARTAEA
jgi:V/A-type H+/Na+-transporting ATPase subunit E